MRLREWIVTGIILLSLFTLSACQTSPPAENLSSGNVPATIAEVTRITAEALWQKMESGADIAVVDLRDEAEYNQDHIAGAVWVSYFAIISGEWPPPDVEEIIFY